MTKAEQRVVDAAVAWSRITGDAANSYEVKRRATEALGQAVGKLNREREKK